MDFVAWVPLGITVAGALGWAARTLWVVGRRIGDLHDDWQGEPDRPGVKGRKGVMERLRAIEQELHPNGGSSLRDAVDRVESRLDAHERAHVPVQVNVGTMPAADSSA